MSERVLSEATEDIPSSKRAVSRLRRFAPLALGAAAFALAGCGGGGGASTETASSAPEEQSAPSADLCALLTAADIEEVLGEAPGAGQNESEGMGQCRFATADGSGTLVLLTLERAILSSFDDFVVAFGEEFGGENPPRDEYHPVEGVPGDWAMYVAEDHMVRAFRGDEVLEVSAPGADEARVVDLATRAMGRLP